MLTETTLRYVRNWNTLQREHGKLELLNNLIVQVCYEEKKGATFETELLSRTLKLFHSPAVGKIG